MGELSELYETVLEQRRRKAKPRVLDFTNVVDYFQHATGKFRDDRVKPVSADGRQLSPKQIRARLRRKQKRMVGLLDMQEVDALFGTRKPVSEWDLEELARGRPRNLNGNFRGSAPKWVDSRVHEEAMKVFVERVKGEMKSNTGLANNVMRDILTNDDVDDKGKPLVPYGTKLDAAKFLLEHTVGKPTQRIEQDLSVRLQGILGTVIASPRDVATGYVPSHFPGITMALATKEADGDDDEFDGE